MAYLDVHPTSGKGVGYVLDVQAELLAHLATRVVVPLPPEDIAPPPINELNPVAVAAPLAHPACAPPSTTAMLVSAPAVTIGCGAVGSVSEYHRPNTPHLAPSPQPGSKQELRDRMR